MKQVLYLSIFLTIAVTCSHGKKPVIFEAPEARLSLPDPKIIKGLIEELRDNAIKETNNVLKVNGNENLLKPLNLTLDLDLKATGAISNFLTFDVEVKKKFFVTYEIKLTFPKINVNITNYSLKGNIHMIPVVGDGKLNVVVENLTIIVVVKPKITTSKAMTATITLDVEITTFDLAKFELTGWQHDEERSAILSEIVYENLSDVTMSYRAEIKQLLSAFASDKVKDIVIPIE